MNIKINVRTSIFFLIISLILFASVEVYSQNMDSAKFALNYEVDTKPIIYKSSINLGVGLSLYPSSDFGLHFQIINEHSLGTVGFYTNSYESENYKFSGYTYYYAYDYTLELFNDLGLSVRNKLGLTIMDNEAKNKQVNTTQTTFTGISGNYIIGLSLNSKYKQFWLTLCTDMVNFDGEKSGLSIPYLYSNNYNPTICFRVTYNFF